MAPRTPLGLTDQDHELLDQLSDLIRFLNRGATVSLRRVGLYDYDQFAVGIRDLGEALCDVGLNFLTRAHEIDPRDRPAGADDPDSASAGGQ